MNRILFNVTCIVLVISLFSACSSGNKFASSFEKRKYLKGYYQDMASSVPVIANNTYREPLKSGTETNQRGGIKAPDNNPVKLLPQVVKTLTKIESKPVKINLGKAKSASVKNRTLILSNTVPIQNDDGRHINDTDKKSSSTYSVTSLVLFLIGIGILIIGFFAAFAVANQGFLGLLVIIFAALIALVIDAIAIILAIVGIAKNEDRKDLAEVVLIVNAIILIIYSILLAARV